MKNKMIRAVMLLAYCVLTAHAGRITNVYGQTETWYNLRMNRVVSNANNKLGYSSPYWVREDGCKMYGNYIIVAADYNYHPYGSLVMTSRGIGIVLDTGAFKGEQYDLAVNW